MIWPNSKKMGSTLQVQSMILFEMAMCSSVCQHTLSMCTGEVSSAAGAWPRAVLSPACVCPNIRGGFRWRSASWVLPLGEQVGHPPTTPIKAGALCEFGVSIAMNQSSSFSSLVLSGAKQNRELAECLGTDHSSFTATVVPITGDRVTWWTYLNCGEKSHLIEVPELWWQIF